ncbi:efflux RND transporter periplasmic adaptor subunit [Ancylomarina sp. 16SWW S1-10-2]|uniref:efflux RND transporter periplasmic adaptor subunit n=1 Tax=Ancylomarina sp. 16SWW S1-10-2 TaxID=2499681 RepID=UPI0012AE3305|nr:efflux RND transporter periplasmic adaptor subunit [Ancylomarina sp. 16SWW S1-10-2]MRT92818.1 efflux RND transporter periplasmic adaptor subunit [Ancylomarina sp. 16SWW S1-10-2]
MNRRIKSLNKIVIIVMSLTVLASCSGEKENQNKANPELSVLEVKAENQQFNETFTSTIKGKQDIGIWPKVTGFITGVKVDEGSIVRKGQLLFSIDPVQYQEAVNVAKANVAVANASVATAKLTAENKKALGDRNIISSYEVQLSQNELGSNKAQLALAEAQLISAQKDLSYTRITSPTDGIIGKIPFRLGTLVSSSMSDAMTTVTEFSSMYAYFSITEKKLLSLSKENSSTKDIIKSLPKVQLKLSDGSIYIELGTIETISGTIDESTGAASIRASFPNENGILRSGGTATIILPYSLENCLLIPQNATFEIQDKKFVYTVDKDSKVSATEIVIYPLNNGSDYVVTKGLSTGDKIVIEGINSIQNGSTIKVNLNTEYYAEK